MTVVPVGRILTEMFPESPRAQNIVTWQVRRTGLPLIQRRCPGCGSGTFKASGKFRVNANGKLIDVWLLLQCASCDRTEKATVIERSASIDATLLRRFETNDPDLVTEVLLDPAVARKNHLTLEWEDSWEVVSDLDMPGQKYPYSVRVTFADPIPLRPSHVISKGLGVSRSKIKQMVDTQLIVLPCKLGARTSAAFTFTVMAEEISQG